jgi:hypothetical protein
MQIFEEDAHDLCHKRTWFTREIEDDPWVVYHGTSSVSEESIERLGFRCGSTGLNHGTLLCLTIVKTIGWEDVPRGAALQAYTFPRINSGSLSPFFCAFFPQRAIAFTCRQYAGGETAYTLREAITGLERLASETPDWFDKRFEEQSNLCTSRARRGIPTHTPVYKVNVEWFQCKMRVLLPQLCELREIYDQHKYGVIYAIKLDRADAKIACNGDLRGLEVFGEVSPSKCVAKLIVHGEHSLGDDCGGIDWDLLNSRRDRSDLATLANYCPKDCGSKNADDLFDAEGALDMRWDLMATHGNTLVREFVKNNRPSRH